MNEELTDIELKELKEFFKLGVLVNCDIVQKLVNRLERVEAELDSAQYNTAMRNWT